MPAWSPSQVRARRAFSIALTAASARARCNYNFMTTARAGVLDDCLPLCDPRAPSRPGSSSCQYDHDEQFTCNRSFDRRTHGEPCGATAQCVDGLTCGAALDVPGCAGDFCSTAFCDVGAPNACPDAPLQQCLPYFENLGGETPPGLEDIGVCAIP